MQVSPQDSVYGTKPAGSASPMNTVWNYFHSVLKHGEFADALITALDVTCPPEATVKEREQFRHADFDNLIGRIVRNIVAHPRRKAVRALFNDTGISDADALSAFEFIYSHVVNKFKGEIAELLARPQLRMFVSQLTTKNPSLEHLNIVPGHELRSQRLNGRPGQHQCADAILLALRNEWIQQIAEPTYRLRSDQLVKCATRA